MKPSGSGLGSASNNAQQIIWIFGISAHHNFAAIASIERKDRKFSHPTESRLDSTGKAVVTGGCAASGEGLLGELHPLSSAGSGCLNNSKGHPRRTSAVNLCRAGSEAQRVAEKSARLKNVDHTFSVEVEVDNFRLAPSTELKSSHMKHGALRDKSMKEPPRMGKCYMLSSLSKGMDRSVATCPVLRRMALHGRTIAQIRPYGCGQSIQRAHWVEF